MSLEETGQRFWAALLRAPAIPLDTLRNAIAAVGSVQELAGTTAAQLRELQLPPACIAALLRPDERGLAADLAWLANAGARLLPCTDPDWPAQLDQIADAPCALYVRGDARALQAPQLAIVGSRTPTAAGRRIALQLAGELADAGFVITSGLARGIDAAAHEGALQRGAATLAVCGTGLDVCYPATNRELAARIRARGALVSELPPGTGPRAWHFPRRNRIIAALARGTIVVEAAARSGSLVTARLAGDYGREVFAVPGSPLNPLAAGCLELLREGATLARGAADVLAQVRLPIEKQLSFQDVTATPQTPGGVARLDKDYEMLLDALGFEPASIDDLVERTGLAPGSVASMILILELSGRVEQRPGALFNRVD